LCIKHVNRRLLEQAAAENAEKLDKHRFLVQTKVIEDEDFSKLIALPTAQRADEVCRQAYLPDLLNCLELQSFTIFHFFGDKK
jgi:lipoate synthase